MGGNLVKIVEEKRDLTEVNKYVKIPYAIAFYASADLVMSSGINQLINRHWRVRSKILELNGPLVRDFQDGLLVSVPPSNFQEFTVFALITKRFNFHTDTYQAMQHVLELLKDEMETNGLSKVAMPKYTGQLEWNKVKSLIKKIFQETNITIKVCV